jgi:hypothetical protein
MDPTALRWPNVGRHVAGVRDVGRRKTAFMAEKIRDKNPCANVETCARKITWQTQDLVRGFVRRSDLVIAAVDDREARVILNKICVEEGKPLIVPGAFRRAYGGQILFVKPGIHAVLSLFPGGVYLRQAVTRRSPNPSRPLGWPTAIALVAYRTGACPTTSPRSADGGQARAAVSDPGPSQHTELTDEDLVARWYIWLNRRKPKPITSSSTPSV